MRLSDRFLLLCLLLSILALASLLEAGFSEADDGPSRALVSRLGLTDPALFSEARYTRHLSQADSHAPFQDHPLALEHFPSGSLTPPPRQVSPR